ncbi:MAG: twin-arginine translocase subunit TatC [Acidobacteriota bacterium]|nr:twin-arginine translocase subunit TatC [Blastocatellia bacterium]MDW8240986.1 twin-arginine translocase subunit TatC [Acidobacteriota bacterium]
MMSNRVSVPTDADEAAEELREGEMSLLDHLDELRRRLTYSAIAVAVFFVLSWTFAERLYHFLEKPVLEVLERVERTQLASVVRSTPVWSLQENDSVQYTFREESRLGDIPIPAGVTIPGTVQRRNGQLVVVTKEAWVVGQTVIPAGTPLPVQVQPARPSERLIISTVPGAFSLYIQVAFYAAIFFAMPFILYQAWAFVSPGLYKHEKRYALPFIFMGSIFFLLGAAFGYKIAFPRAAEWLLGLASGFRPLINAGEYFNLILIIMLGLGAVFQIPTITFFLARIGVVTPRKMVQPWRVVLVAIFVVAAVISPTGDIPNLLVFALPMILLYILSIGIAWLFGKPRQEELSS